MQGPGTGGAAGRIVAVPPHRWHVVEGGPAGEAARPALLLLHGAGASVHSWRGLLPVLGREARVLAVDLPGQGLSRAGSLARLTPEAMAEDLARLLAALGVVPAAVVGHSAGAAVALRLAGPDGPAPRAVVAVNGALAPFEGTAGWLFPLLARAMALNPLTAPFLALGATRESVRRIIEATGSRLGPEGLEAYRRLMADRRHVQGTLAMMARWRLEPLIADLPRIAVPTLFLVGGHDRAVPPGTARAAAARMPAAEVRELPGLGHLMHEEAPETVAAAILDWLRPRLAPEPGRA